MKKSVTGFTPDVKRPAQILRVIPPEYAAIIPGDNEQCFFGIFRENLEEGRGEEPEEWIFGQWRVRIDYR